MANEQVCAAQAATRDVGNAPPSAAQDCSDVIHLAVFFDGTGNNKDADEAKKKWSNVGRIWRAAYQYAIENPNTYPVYIAGVGTPFNGKAFFPGEEDAIASEDGKRGLVAGAGGSRRLDYGQQQINDALRMALLSKAKTLDGQVAKYAETGKQQSFSEVNRALGKHRLIKQINVSIFGFSRGAALARAFCNQWLWQCKEDHGQLSYEGHPIRFCFLGLFDTVASFGLPATNSANNPVLGGFKGRDLVVDERVERCVHYVAGHELRFAFPVDLIRRDGKLAGNWLEKVYPGVHSDIGGGYEPYEQEIHDNYARVPMRDMMQEAYSHGARLLSYTDLDADRYRALFRERYECRPETETAYKAYCAACSPAGTVEQQVQKHMAQLYSAYGTLHRQGGESVTQREHRRGQSWSRLAPDDMAKELENYDKAQKEMAAAIQQSAKAPSIPGISSANDVYIIRKATYAMWISPAAWQRQAWARKASDGVMSFIHGYVHDSKVGFMSNAEPFSYFSKRGIGESSRSVRGWFEDNVSRPVDKAYESTVDAASRGIDKGVEAAKKAQETVAEKARQAGEAVSEAAGKARQAASDAANKIGDAANQAIQQGKDLARSTGNSIGKLTQDAANGLGAAWEFVTH